MDEGLTLLASEPVIGLDLETSGLSPWNDKIGVVALYGPKQDVAVVFHIRGRMPARLKEFLGEPRTWIGHNVCTFDSMFLANAGVNIFGGRWVDTLIAEQCIITSSRSDVKKNLEASVKRRLGKELKKDIAHGHWMDDHLTPAQEDYVCGDIVYLPALWEKQVQEAQKKGVEDALYFEQDLIPAVQRIMLNGLPVDIHRLREWREAARLRAREAGAQLDARLGGINLNSPAQLKRALSNLGIELPDTRKETLLELAGHSHGPEQHMAALLLEYRFGTKRATTYSDEWIKKFVHQGRIHSRFQQCATDTGRFSSAEPNLQQLPRDQAGCRPYIGWWPKHSIVSADYSGIEAVVGAALAKDKEYLAMLSAGDMHTAVAAQMFDISVEEVTAERRQMAKAASFTLLFGGGAGRLAQYARNLGANLDEAGARDISKAFFDRFQGIKALRSRAYGLAKDGYPVTIVLPTGLKRVLVGEKLKGTILLNTKVQGTAAAGLKTALALAHKKGLTKYLGATVHDEFVACVPDAEAAEYAEALRSVMLEGMRSIDGLAEAPVKVGTGVAPYWKH